MNNNDNLNKLLIERRRNIFPQRPLTQTAMRQRQLFMCQLPTKPVAKIINTGRAPKITIILQDSNKANLQHNHVNHNSINNNNGIENIQHSTNIHHNHGNQRMNPHSMNQQRMNNNVRRMM